MECVHAGCVNADRVNVQEVMETAEIMEMEEVVMVENMADEMVEHMEALKVVILGDHCI